jgi:hypothetical protein
VVQVRKRGYILPGKVIGGTHYFCVDKGLDDIRMVYNGTSCGLNEVLWAPALGYRPSNRLFGHCCQGIFSATWMWGNSS